MYGWLWRRLPGPVGVRVGLAAVLVLAGLVACDRWIFPMLADAVVAPAPTIG